MENPLPFEKHGVGKWHRIEGTDWEWLQTAEEQSCLDVKKHRIPSELFSKKDPCEEGLISLNNAWHLENAIPFIFKKGQKVFLVGWRDGIFPDEKPEGIKTEKRAYSLAEMANGALHFVDIMHEAQEFINKVPVKNNLTIIAPQRLAREPTAFLDGTVWYGRNSILDELVRYPFSKKTDIQNSKRVRSSRGEYLLTYCHEWAEMRGAKGLSRYYFGGEKPTKTLLADRRRKRLKSKTETRSIAVEFLAVMKNGKLEDVQFEKDRVAMGLEYAKDYMKNGYPKRNWTSVITPPDFLEKAPAYPSYAIAGYSALAFVAGKLAEAEPSFGEYWQKKLKEDAHPLKVNAFERLLQVDGRPYARSLKKIANQAVNTPVVAIDNQARRFLRQFGVKFEESKIPENSDQRRNSNIRRISGKI